MRGLRGPGLPGKLFGGDLEQDAVDDGGGLEADLQQGEEPAAFRLVQPGLEPGLMCDGGGQETFQGGCGRLRLALEVPHVGEQEGMRGGGEAREDTVGAGVEVAGLPAAATKREWRRWKGAKHADR